MFTCLIGIEIDKRYLSKGKLFLKNIKLQGFYLEDAYDKVSKL